ncbi:MAG TPA: type II toxin-antitoxin system HicA family toxin [bacterium]|nr:type II toxin-antitoxin system HicA family toxin [bacterium]HQG46431.1 type II toxin-antitoxin system HicA family toxin [bacterium]HQJ65439.1 type II toxin-antitoxin system HicA family toxin [bacterium]
MSKIEKVLEHWRRRPPEVRRDEVLSVLKHYGFEVDTKRGSHIFVRHLRLIGRPGYDALGGFVFPGQGGQRVKGAYLKDILQAIDMITEEEQ